MQSNRGKRIVFTTWGSFGIVSAQVRGEDGTRVASDAIVAELSETPQARPSANNNGKSPRPAMPLHASPGRKSSIAAKPAAFRLIHRKPRPIMSRPNPWRWEFDFAMDNGRD